MGLALIVFGMFLLSQKGQEPFGWFLLIFGVSLVIEPTERKK